MIRGHHNHDIYMGKIGARKVSKKIKELSEVATPAVSVASALLEKHLYLQSTAGTKFSRRKKYQELEAKVENSIEHHQSDGFLVNVKLNIMNELL